MTATIFDVAKQAGVSIGTVSRVLNNRDRVSPETRARVLQAVHDLNYHANALAKGLASQQTQTLGLVIPHLNDAFYFQILRGVEDVATDAGYRLLIASQPRHASEHQYLNLFQRGHVDAMVLVAIDVKRREAQEVAERGVPIVLVQQDVGQNVQTILADNYGGGRAMTEHLIEHGYRRIAYITGTDYTTDSRERLRGIRDVLPQYGLEIPDSYIVHGDYMPQSGYHAMLQLLKLPELPDAIFAANDQMAVDAIMAARESGLRVPEDIAVVGFDDIPMASYVSPALTTVHQPVYELGWHAARQALDAIHLEESSTKRVAPRVLVLPTTLVIRQSCGCAGS